MQVIQFGTVTVQAYFTDHVPQQVYQVVFLSYRKKPRIFSLLHVINNMLPLITWMQIQFHDLKRIMCIIKSIEMAPEPIWPVINIKLIFSGMLHSVAIIYFKFL